ncbi:hypothetical protein BJY01DRAFT_226977 [Aspergillus pseudoustus]|uniref:Zn(2)-C6 fungal-type domain-containing protein n=1 Tax=Aspergillus pseudoustus TaxID=1810923 RepID=A0ABR4ISL0_9EURO
MRTTMLPTTAFPDAAHPHATLGEISRRATSTPVTTLTQTLTPASKPVAASTRGVKKRRINYACNHCRARKTRCDESKPSCRACQVARVECVTTNLRKPDLNVVRREAGRATREAPSTTAPPDSSSRQLREVVPRFASSQSSTSLLHSHPKLSDETQQRKQPEGQEDGGETDGDDEEREEGHSKQIQQPLLSAPNSPRRARSSMPVFQQTRGVTYCEILSDWVDLARHRLGIRNPSLTQPIDSQDTRTPPLGLSSVGLCLLPPPETLAHAADLFLRGPNILFPIFAPGAVQTVLEAAQSRDPVVLVRQAGYPSLLITYLILLVGGFCSAKPLPDLDVEALLDACSTLMGHVLQDTALLTVKAMLLLAMAHRCCNNIMASWNAMSLAVSTANTIRLAQTASGPDRERGMVWGSVCLFEKLLAFELGRSSCTAIDGFVRDHDITALPRRSFSPAGGNEEQSLHQTDATRATESLILTLDEAAKRCIQCNVRINARPPASINASIHDKVKTTGEAILLLIDWANSVPYALSPEVDLIQDQRYQPFETFLSLQYYSAIILLSRNSLLISQDALHQCFEEISTGAHWESIVRNGQSIAANAARKILHLVVRASEASSPSVLTCPAAALHAIVALTIHVVVVTSRVSAADDSLLWAATGLLRERCSGTRTETAVQSLLRNLEVMRQDALRSSATHFGPASSPATTAGPGQAQAAPHHHLLPQYQQQQQQQQEPRPGFLPGLVPGDTGNGGTGLQEMQWLDEIGWDWSDLTNNFSMAMDVPPDTPPATR